jgi:hypothetical protein
MGIIWGKVCVIDDNPAIFNPNPAFPNEAHRQGVNSVFHGKNAGGQTFFIVLGTNWHSALDNDGSRIQFWLDEMYGTPRDAHASVKGALVNIKPPKGGQQGWMNVEHSFVPIGHKFVR